jgi:hypothetical protein
MIKPFHGRRAGVSATLAATALALGGCVEIGPGGAEAKLGVGPFKAYSLEAGPGGVEEKGPSAGPFKVRDKDRD